MIFTPCSLVIVRGFPSQPHYQTASPFDRGAIFPIHHIQGLLEFNIIQTSLEFHTNRNLSWGWHSVGCNTRITWICANAPLASLSTMFLIWRHLIGPDVVIMHRFQGCRSLSESNKHGDSVTDSSQPCQVEHCVHARALVHRAMFHGWPSNLAPYLNNLPYLSFMANLDLFWVAMNNRISWYFCGF